MRLAERIMTLTPSPPLPRKRGREQTEFAARDSTPDKGITSPAAASAASAGDGSGAALGLWQGDGAGGLERAGRGFARRQFLRREVVDGHGDGDGRSGGAEFFRFGLGE